MQLTLQFGEQLNAAAAVPFLAERIRDHNLFALYSKRRETKDGFIRLLLERATGMVVYLGPKILVPHIRTLFPSVRAVALENLPKRDTFLDLNTMVGPETTLILENVSRYTKLDSNHFRYIHRLAKSCGYRYLVDIVPFFEDITKLYLPLSYLDRQILGYPNGYAFEEEYLEEDEAGQIRRSHDLDYLAGKVGPWCYIDYREFLPEISFVETVLTEKEEAGYQVRKLDLFQKYNNPRKIVTRLCDYTNVMESRCKALAGLLEELGEETVIYTNIGKDAGHLKRYLGRPARVEITTYTTYDGNPVEAGNIIFFETPINQNKESAMDILAGIGEGSKVYYFRSSAKVDSFVFGEVWPAWQAVNDFSRELSRYQER